MRRQRGFTLVEVLVALAVMAVLAALSWRGLDAMVRARDGSQESLERTTLLNTILAQWQQDFNALYDSGVVPPLAYDGRTLLLTRIQGDGVALVAWSLRDGAWQRWANAATTQAPLLQDAWMRGQQLLGNEPGQVRLLDGVTQLQLYYYRGNGWSNAQSSGEVAVTRTPDSTPQGVAPPTPPEAGANPNPTPTTPTAPAVTREVLPDGVRLVLTLPDGVLTRDIRLGPHGT